jgi:hypothetical protein
MKKGVYLAVVLVLLSLLFISCVSESKTISSSPVSSSPISSPTISKIPVPATSPVAVTFNATAPDDIFPTPGGDAYAANVFQGGVPNPWPPVAINFTILVNGPNHLIVNYRSNIDTKAGQTRNNIIQVSQSTSFLVSGNLSLYSLALPLGIALGIDGGSGLPGQLTRILVMKIFPDVALGSYNIQIGIEVNGVDYGMLPCTLNVLK